MNTINFILIALALVAGAWHDLVEAESRRRRREGR